VCVPPAWPSPKRWWWKVRRRVGGAQGDGQHRGAAHRDGRVDGGDGERVGGSRRCGDGRPAGRCEHVDGCLAVGGRTSLVVKCRVGPGTTVTLGAPAARCHAAAWRPGAASRRPRAAASRGGGGGGRWRRGGGGAHPPRGNGGTGGAVDGDGRAAAAAARVALPARKGGRPAVHAPDGRRRGGPPPPRPYWAPRGELAGPAPRAHPPPGAILGRLCCDGRLLASEDPRVLRRGMRQDHPWGWHRPPFDNEVRVGGRYVLAVVERRHSDFPWTTPSHAPSCILLLCTSFVVNRFFVPPTEKQPQMTGRLWRHGLTMMPHMIAGVGGPAEQRPVRHLDAAPARAAVVRRRAASNDDEIDDGHGPEGAVLVPAEEVLPDPVVPDVTTSAKYRALYGHLPLHRAVLDVYCRLAALGGRLMGDNMDNMTHMSEQQMRSLADEAQDLIIQRVNILFGPVLTTKAHRLANHLLVALLNNGNLWEGDTSENQGLHGPCKKMYGRRTNRRGPGFVLQMMRASETQSEVLREL